MITELDIEQYSDEWWWQRRGRFGASESAAIRVAKEGLKTLAKKKTFNLTIPNKELYFEHLKRTKEYKSEQMEMGNANEIFARHAAEQILGVKIREIGMCVYNDFAGFSPDGRIDEWNCGVEIKNIDSGTGQDKFLLASDGLFNKLSDYDQIQMSLALSGWNFWIYVLYSEVLWGNQPKIFKIMPDQDLIPKYLHGIEEGSNLILERLNKYINAQNNYTGFFDIFTKNESKAQW